MKRLYPVAFALIAFSVNSQIINIPDANFKNALVNTICADLDDNGFSDSDADTNNDGEIDQAEALAVFALFTGDGSGPPPFRVSAENTSSPSTINPISDPTGLEYFLNLKALNLNNNSIASLDVSMLSQLRTLQCASNQMTQLTLGNLSLFTMLDCGSNNLSSLDVSGTPGLINLWFNLNNIPSIDTHNLPGLKRLYCAGNSITALDLSQNTALLDLRCQSNSLTALVLQNQSLLTSLNCSDNLISTLDVSALPSLQTLICNNNSLTALDLSGLENLSAVYCSSNQLTDIIVQDNNALSQLYCRYNLLQSLVLNETPIILLHCDNNPNLESVFVKNGVTSEVLFGTFPAPPIASFDFTNDPLLASICADESEVGVVQGYLTGQTNVTTYCNFAPGGSYNTIAGNIQLGCPTGMAVNGIKIGISDGATSGYSFTGVDGNYILYGQQQLTITPLLENAAYFNVSPANYVLSLTGTGNTANADFCLSANGIHPDLEIAIAPITPARPGFDAVYKLIYQNNGTEIQSGTVNLNFAEPQLDLVTAAPGATSSQSGLIAWDFDGLMPFETREITFIMNLNSPVETPPVNSGDHLTFNASIVSGTDETPGDNAMEFTQTVVGSYDPNDKTVIEGSLISTSQADDYLHYVVRFQNTGNYPAENVVVKDMLSANLDLSTLEMVSASHPYRSTLTQGNKLEFFFEGINLPDAAANEPQSHGFVAFKVKPKQTIGVGDVVENTANIYFDFNAPVATNMVSTTVSALGLNSHEVSNFSMYPNPAKNMVEVTSDKNFDSITVFNLLRQKVLSKTTSGSHATVDISALNSGTYLIEVKADSEKVVKKLIKM